MFEREMGIDFLKRLGIQQQVYIRRRIERVRPVAGRTGVPVLAKLLRREMLATPVPYHVAVGILDRITGVRHAIGVPKDVASYVCNIGISGHCWPRQTPESFGEVPSTPVPGLRLGNAPTPGDLVLEVLL